MLLMDGERELHTPRRVSDSLHTRISEVTSYSRRDVLRILHLQTRQLGAWERAGLVGAHEQYSFEHLVQLRKLRDLSATRITVKSIRASVDAMQKAAGMTNPLLEAASMRRGSRLVFRHSGSLVDAVTQQLVFDFELEPAGPVAVCEAEHAQARRAAQAQEMFLTAVQLEETPATLPEAQCMYERLLEIDPRHAAASINLGTIYYNQRMYGRAEEMYRAATVMDPEYALAFFDLGNVLDELQRLNEAIAAYQRAVALVPQYADAHYNLALAYERQGQQRRALRHWLMYCRLDPVGPWASHAKTRAKKILGNERLTIVSRRGRLVAS